MGLRFNVSPCTYFWCNTNLHRGPQQRQQKICKSVRTRKLPHFSVLVVAIPRSEDLATSPNFWCDSQVIILSSCRQQSPKTVLNFSENIRRRQHVAISNYGLAQGIRCLPCPLVDNLVPIKTCSQVIWLLWGLCFAVRPLVLELAELTNFSAGFRAIRWLSYKQVCDRNKILHWVTSQMSTYLYMTIIYNSSTGDVLCWPHHFKNTFRKIENDFGENVQDSCRVVLLSIR